MDQTTWVSLAPVFEDVLAIFVIQLKGFKHIQAISADICVWAIWHPSYTILLLACLASLCYLQSRNAGSSVGVDSDFPNLLGQSSMVGATSQDKDESPHI